MMTDADVRQLVRDAFGRCERPTHFTDFRHCPDCAEANELLCSRDNDTLSIEDVGDPGGPLCHAGPDGFAYFFPALARLTLAEEHPSFGLYAPRLLFHLTYQDEANELLAGFDPDQRRAVAVLLRHVAETRAELLGGLDTADLARAIRLWSTPD